jgi:hypothetical protein
MLRRAFDVRLFCDGKDNAKDSGLEFDVPRTLLSCA